MTKLQSVGASVAQRTTGEGQPFKLQCQLDGTVGVVEQGLFLGLASRVIVGGALGVHVLQSTRND